MYQVGNIANHYSVLKLRHAGINLLLQCQNSVVVLNVVFTVHEGMKLYLIQ